MSVLRPAYAVALTTAAALALAGCGGSSGKTSTDEPSSSASAPSATTSTSTPSDPTTTADATDTPSGEPSASSSECEASEPGAIPDGRWSGPITMDVDGKAGQTGFGSSQGKGQMRLVVSGGKVTSGTWKVTWKSQGHADTGQAAADIKLTGTIGGGAKGPATKPLLLGTWAIHGTATITKPVHSSAPVDETGKDNETLTIGSATCESVTASFIPSFNSKDAAATFTGKAEWAGTKQ